MKARLERLRALLGWPGLLGLVLLVGGLAADALVRQPLANRLAALDQRAGQAERDARRPAVAMATELGRFYKHFQREEDINDWLAVLYHAAEESGVELGVADYRLVAHPVLALASYEITVPLTGQYGTLRAFAETLLNNIPVASVDALRFARKRVGAGQVEAEMRLTIYVPRK